MNDVKNCPKCNKPMTYDIELDYDHSPFYCQHCGYAEGCYNEFNENCNRCTEFSHCKKWNDIQNGDTDINIPRCSHCGRKCTEINEYIVAANGENTTPETYVKQDGTYNRNNNTFTCTVCYVKSIM